jgi:hypothetical protein
MKSPEIYLFNEDEVYGDKIYSMRMKYPEIYFNQPR